MPRGKYARKNKRNENVLISKLMQLNLRMDDHIYYNKIITTSEAATHLQEIATLKLQCVPTNVRALQVIEKLTRFMSKILTEEDTGYVRSSHENTFQIYTEFAGSASPVYSLPDEDRTNDINEESPDINTTYVSEDDEMIGEQNHIYHRHDTRANFTEHLSSLSGDNRSKDINGHNVNGNNTTTKQSNVSHEKFNLTTSDKPGHLTITRQAENTIPNLKNTFNDGQVIDITNDSDTEETTQSVAVTNEQSIAIEQVNTGISNLLIQDKVFNRTNVDDDCSQSILDKYDNEYEATNKPSKMPVEKKVYNEKATKACVINKVTNYFQKQMPLKQVPSQGNVTPTTSSTEHDKLDFNVNSNSKIDDQGTAQEKDKSGRKKKVTNENNKPKGRKFKNKSKLKTVNGNDTPNYLQNRPITNMFTEVTNKRTNTKDNRPKAVKQSKNLENVNEIYNENVENDLSWVENIRYVREISSAEYDPTLAVHQDKFWDNFELPAYWNDLDFEM